MIGKILVTLAVIVACMWMLSARTKPTLKTIPDPAAERNRILLRNAAIGFMVIMSVAAGTMVFLEADNRGPVVTVHVVNTQSGARKSYQARKSDIQSDGFTTLDGLQVFVAGIERIEVETR